MRLILIILSNNQISDQLIAVSFDTVTYRDLQHFLSENNPLNYELSRIDPFEFLQEDQPAPGSYINLVTKDIQLRQQVTEKIDLDTLDRFSLIHEMSYTGAANIGPGCMIYPMVSMYSNATLVKDNIVHSSTMIAHDCYLDVGSYVSAGVNIAGTTKIGKFCFLGLASVINDHIVIVDQVTVGTGALVRKSITHPGVYITQSLSNLTKLT